MKKQKRKKTNAMRKKAQPQASGIPSATGRRKRVLGILCAGTILVVASAFAYDVVTEKPAPKSAARASSMSVAAGDARYLDQAKVQIPTEERELGNISVANERTAVFFIRNVGGKPLQISQVRTSCMCTYAQVIIADNKSPLFNMAMHHSPAVQSWQGVVEPGLTAMIRIIYRPYMMPVKGSVARNVKFNTNDPTRPVVELGIHATVH